LLSIFTDYFAKVIHELNQRPSALQETRQEFTDMKPDREKKDTSLSKGTESAFCSTAKTTSTEPADRLSPPKIRWKRSANLKNEDLEEETRAELQPLDLRKPKSPKLEQKPACK